MLLQLINNGDGFDGTTVAALFAEKVSGHKSADYFKSGTTGLSSWQ